MKRSGGVERATNRAGAGAAAVAAVLAASLVMTACATEVNSTPEGAGVPTTIELSPITTATVAAPTTLAPTTAPPTAAPESTTTTAPPTTTTTAPPTPATTTTAPGEAVLTFTSIAPAEAPAIAPNQEVEFGRSVEGRPLTLIRRGIPGGVRIVVVGIIHGNEPAGLRVIDRLRAIEVPAGVELFLVPSLNPDGAAIGDRQNANQVDLNRNFPANWAPLGVPGDWQYGGPSAASEPETQAMVALGEAVRPDLVFWYHQDLFRIAPGVGRPGEVRTRFAELTGLPIVEISGGSYTGTGSQWAATVLTDPGVGITVELGPTITDAEVDAHAGAILTVAQEFF